MYGGGSELKIGKLLFSEMAVLSIKDDRTSPAVLGIATAWQRHSSSQSPTGSWSPSFSQPEMAVLNSSCPSITIDVEAVDRLGGVAAFVPVSHNAGQKSSIATRPSQRTATRFLTIFLRTSFSMPFIKLVQTPVDSSFLN
jgi:hypothetical protein